MIVFTLIGVWELCKLGELIESFDSERIPIDSSLRISGQYPYYGATGIIDYIDSYIFDGEYVLLAEDGANIIMRNYPVAYLTQGKFWLNNHAHIMRMVKGDNQFLVQILEKMNYSKYNTGTAQPKLNSNIVKRINLRVPIPEEQQKIGTLFKQLDDTITLHQRKLDQLKKLKKAYLQAMFVSMNTKKNKVPKLRFTDFKGEWKLCKLENIIEKQIKGKAKVENLCNGSVEYLDANRLNGGKPIYTKALPDVSERDIIILWDGSKAGKVYYGFKGVLGSTLKAYQLKECANSQFIYQQLLDNQNNIYNNYRTPNIPHVVKNFSSIFPIWMTSFEEQSQMADILSNLDNRIILQQNLIDTMISLKKSYLQNMFI
ncbi:restriction endonuclease subunit S [Enterococcus faecalis]|nr:restriction endonuclease subunit S [Enterococcus faecalis]EGO2632576.1 restriction endonuclease subunit S [Enterococcus faecalis]EGO7618223.1 restriction endonuclease subunit S [Enterococcus faecalis]EGO7913075.1 restriction endonuclease subunit S [Enterococcus faecalis]EHG5970951.1 restriction endonuclease subunit S [Enterococcus faecalis]EHU8863180.1 restriction endonuclease subunit S [Enterococcus faecalis]